MYSLEHILYIVISLVVIGLVLFAGRFIKKQDVEKHIFAFLGFCMLFLSYFNHVYNIFHKRNWNRKCL